MVQSVLVNCYPARYRIAALKEMRIKNLLQGAGAVHGATEMSKVSFKNLDFNIVQKRSAAYQLSVGCKWVGLPALDVQQSFKHAKCS